MANEDASAFSPSEAGASRSIATLSTTKLRPDAEIEAEAPVGQVPLREDQAPVLGPAVDEVLESEQPLADVRDPDPVIAAGDVADLADGPDHAPSSPG